MDDNCYIKGEQYLKTLHAMISAGEEGSEKADELREEATVIWKKLSPLEQQRLQRLSANLANSASARQESGSPTA